MWVVVYCLGLLLVDEFIVYFDCEWVVGVMLLLCEVVMELGVILVVVIYDEVVVLSLLEYFCIWGVL